MTFTQIATLLNTTIVPNALGENATIAEDLSNVVDLGTALADLSADDLKNYMKDLAVGVYDTFVDSRKYKDESFGLFISDIEWGGALQRGKAKLLNASATNILTLESANDPVSGANAPDYTDGKFYGTNWDSRVYTKDAGFKVKYSISTEMFKKSFTSASGVQKLIAMIEANVDNTLRVELNGLARATLRQLIATAVSGNRYINLITTYNTKHGYTQSDPGYITLANWSTSTTFKLWVQTLMLELRKYITDMNNKYGNGTVEVFTPPEDTRCILLTEFAAELDVALGSVYHKEMVEGTGEYYTVNYWQNASDDLLPTIASGSVHDEIVIDGGEAADTTISHIVGVLFDRYSAFITNRLEKTTTKYVPEEDFTTYFHHVVKSYAIDPRNTAVVLLLA